MPFTGANLSLFEGCTQVVLVAPVDAVCATYASALAFSPFVPQNCRIVVCDVTQDATGAGREVGAAPSDSSASRQSRDTAASTNATTAAANTFSPMLRSIATRVRQHRAPRPHASGINITQFFYGGVSPNADEIDSALKRVEVRPQGTTAAAAATIAAVEQCVVVMVLNSQTLGAYAEDAMEPYEALLRSVWTGGMAGTATATPSSSSSSSSAAAAGSASGASRRHGSLIILADHLYRNVAAAMVKTVASSTATEVVWSVMLAYVHAMDPPALEYGSAEAFVESEVGLMHGGTLPVLCAGNVLGLLRHFPVNRSEPAMLTPVDVALNAALLGFIMLRGGDFPMCVENTAEMQYVSRYAPPTTITTNDKASTSTPSKPAQHRAASFAVAESHRPGEASLVWGMFGEYLMSYYARFNTAIAAAFPVPDVVSTYPLLQFPFSLADVVNFGPEPRCPMYPVEAYRAYQQRERVMQDFHGPECTQRMRGYVQQIDDTVRHIADAASTAREEEQNAAHGPRARTPSPYSFAIPAYQLDDFNAAAYQHLLRRLTDHHPLMRYHQCVALAEVDWEAYIYTVARAVLVHIAHCVLGGAAPKTLVSAASIASIAGVKGGNEAPVAGTAGGESVPVPAKIGAEMALAFPEPRRSFTNDIVYVGPERLPEFPSYTRQIFTSATFLHRVALCANGRRSAMIPGMTSRTLAAILAQPHIQQLMMAIAAKDGASKQEVEQQATRILLRAGDKLNHVQCRTMGLMIREVFKRLYRRVDVNYGAFERLHRQLAMPRVALVLIPLHRSYVDFLILSFLLAEMQSPLPHIVAGEDFLSMGPVATLMRGSGAFFMRRTFRGDPLYAALFKEYVRQMVLSYQPLEFFIEGTRSRTGKTMAPKLGILKFVCDTFFQPGQQALDDVLFIPVSLSYDELLEAAVYAKELLGVPKPKETLANFFKASSLLERSHGNINLHMGDPVSLRSLKEYPQQCPAPYKPKTDLPPPNADPVKLVAATSRPTTPPTAAAGMLDTTPVLAKAVSPTPNALLSRVGWHITYQLQRNIVVTPTSIVAALLECLSPYYTAAVRGISSDAKTPAAPRGPGSHDGAGLPLTHLRDGVTWLRGLLVARGARLSCEAATGSTETIVTTSLTHLDRFVHVTEGPAMVVYTTDDVLNRLGVSIATNQLLHVCVDESLIAVVAQAFGIVTVAHGMPAVDGTMKCGMRTVKSEVLVNQTQMLQRLLSVEFPNYAASSPLDFDSWLQCTVNHLQHAGSELSTASGRDTVTTDGGGPLTSIPVTKYYYFLLQLICPHLEALYATLVAASALLHAYPDVPLGAADVVTATLRACCALYEEGVMHYAVAVNKETLQHYFESLIGLSLLKLDRVVRTVESGSKKSSTVVVYRPGAVGLRDSLERLGVLQSQIQPLLWHPSAEERGSVNTAAIKERVLKVYREMTRASKM